MSTDRQSQIVGFVFALVITIGSGFVGLLVNQTIKHSDQIAEDRIKSETTDCEQTKRMDALQREIDSLRAQLEQTQ